jgi:hypothetical protein
VSTSPWSLEPGAQIARRELHERYGGSRQGGMTRSSSTPNLFLFTDPSVGHQHGYYDGWVGDRFHYTGMGQRGDQTFAAGNDAVLHHVGEGRALRLFKGARGTVRYLGEVTLDENDPYYRTDAPETGDGPLRQVIVFRLRPIGDVIHDPEDELRLPGGVGASEVEAAVTGETQVPTTVEVPVEAQQTERAVVMPSDEPYEIERREQTLVLAYKAFLEARGSEVIRFRIQPPGEAKPLYADVYDKTRNNLVEAKGTGARAAIRMALGQLADYGRFINPPPKPAVLLPERPRADLEALLLSQGVHVVWQTREGFADNFNGQFLGSPRS